MLGALLIAMSMQLDRKGLWNLLGPVLCAILFMVTAWVRHTPQYCRESMKHYLEFAADFLLGRHNGQKLIVKQ